MKNTFTLLCFLCAYSLFGQGPIPRAEVNLNEVYSQYSLTGEGVLVVMIDRGIDYSHPDFIDENGDTRFAYIFDMIDQTGAGAPNNPYGVGTVFDHNTINTALHSSAPPLSMDRFGHGTATTGIICGNGSGTADRQFHGVATKATIISIKITHDAFPSFNGLPGQTAFWNPAYIAIALQFAKDKIAELGLPSVTLMNIGSLGGPSDGTSTYSRAIDDYVASGHPFVCGIGDDGGRENNASGNIAQGETAELVVNKAVAGNLRFDLWYSEDDRFTVSFVRPNGTTEGPFTAPGGPNGYVDLNLGDIYMAHRGSNQDGWGSTAYRRELIVDFSGTGIYKVILKGATIVNGKFNASLSPSNFAINNKFESYAVPGGSINDFATAKLNIVPTDYVISPGWYDINGVFRHFTGQGSPGEIWPGSSEGPTQDGRLAPDFAAPGEIALCAHSPNTYYSRSPNTLAQNSNGLYGIQNAVSAAAPLATGIIALMLEVNPDLTAAQIKTILRNSCKQDAFTGTVPNNTWGYGKLDALLAIQNAITLGVEQAGRKNTVVYPNPTTGPFTINLDKKYIDVNVQILTMPGQIISSEKYKDTKKVTSEIKGVAGVYLIKVNAGNRTLKSFKIIKQ
ncbi:S8 family peptidase [Kaistella palustris]|uniref:S8 family peptidase n=1 Tax=Kaistella palustris TaxID=493376 RepID=UPI000407D17D|nr:S8 family peptidase [Kaistella palustris]